MIIKCRYRHKRKLSYLIPGYEVNPTRFLYEPNQVFLNFSSYVFTEDEKSLLCHMLRFSVPPNKIEYADFLTQFECYIRTLKCLE